MNIKEKKRITLKPADPQSYGADMCGGCFFAKNDQMDTMSCNKRVNVCIQPGGRMMIFKEVKPNGD